jgi:hypothetical protein
MLDIIQVILRRDIQPVIMDPMLVKTNLLLCPLHTKHQDNIHLIQVERKVFLSLLRVQPIPIPKEVILNPVHRFNLKDLTRVTDNLLIILQVKIILKIKDILIKES